MKIGYQVVGSEKEYEPKLSETTYSLGHSPTEIQRLKNQGAMLRPITERLLRNAGIDTGMRSWTWAVVPAMSPCSPPRW
jgi:hypothetical protein